MSKIKVLALHGFAQTGPGFYSKSSKLRKVAKQLGIELVYMNGPILLTNDDLPFDANKLGAEGTEYRGWFKVTPDASLQPAIDSISDFIKENGPFDGVLGFSQGAAMAQMITNNMEELGNTKPVKFGVYFSGFVSENKAVGKYLSKKLSVPTLHIMGELDTLVSNERSMEFVDKYCEPGTATVFKHPGGHYVPHQLAPVRLWVKWMVDAFEGTLPKPETSESDAEKERKELDDLADGIDALGKI